MTASFHRIDALFGRLRLEGRPALMPFLTAGDPSLGTTARLLDAIEGAGADLVELGIPYSDPIADGPVIAESYTRALRAGTRLSDILDLVRTRRGAGDETPIVTMVSCSIVFRRGADRYLDEAAAAGVDGLIVPDLPVEEGGDLVGKCAARGLKLIQLITPTTPRERAERILASSSGFVYYVSVAGITGERAALPADLVENVGWLRSRTSLPICVGFGISRPEHVRGLVGIADGVIVGSALVRRLAEADRLGEDGLVAEARGFVESLAGATVLDR